MWLFPVTQSFHVNVFPCVVFNLRSCRPSLQPRNCLRDWRSLWGATLQTTAPWLPTERFTTKEPSSPLRRTDRGRPELGGAEWPWPCGKQALDLAIRSLLTGFYIPRTGAPKGGKMALLGVWGHSWYPDPAQEVSYLFCQSFCSLFSSFVLLKVKLLNSISRGKLYSQDQNLKQYDPSKKNNAWHTATVAAACVTV